MKAFLFFLLTVFFIETSAQYIGVRARYTETRLVDDAPNPPKRENRLILSFFTVSFNGTENVWTPTVLSNYDIWVFKVGLQYGNGMGGVLDSTDNNYPGYAWPAPKVVSYYNTLGLNYIDCNPNIAEHFVVNGQDLDCGFVTVSYWDIDWGTMIPFEAFPAPNVLLPYYWFGDPYYSNPGNVNFDWSVLFPGPPYNMYNFDCGGTLQLVMRGLIGADTGSSVVLPVRFANVRGELRDSNAIIEWSNMTESDIAVYDVERSSDGITWHSAISTVPARNDGGQANYVNSILQNEARCYYRIKATELNGNIYYSNVIVLRKETGSMNPDVAQPVLSVYPNPVTTDQFTFRLANAPKGRYVSVVVAPDGKQLKQKMIEHDGNGDLVRQIETIGLFPGVYRLVIMSTDYRYTQSFLYGY